MIYPWRLVEFFYLFTYTPMGGPERLLFSLVRNIESR
jgi:hypothetical protein